MGIKAADQLPIMDVTDAYSVMLTSEAYTFIGNTSGAPSGLSCITEAVAFCGTNQCASVSVDKSSIILPTGISAAVEGSGTNKVKITFTTTAIISSACEATIPVVVDGITVNKKFSFAVAKAGVNGQDGKDGANGTSVTVSSTSVTYQIGSSGTNKPTGSWSENVPAVERGQYLWTKTVVNYSDGKSTEAYSVSYQGTNGTNGANGTSVTVSSTDVTYQTSSSGTEEPTGPWSPTVPSVEYGQFLWTRTKVTYSDGKSTTSYSVSYKGTNGTNGKDGVNGADAITLTVTSSNGIIFKNNSGSTVLTAHVFKGATEQTVANDGTVSGIGVVKWYKVGGSAPIATAKTLTVSAVDVTNAQAYTCQLED